MPVGRLAAKALGIAAIITTLSGCGLGGGGDNENPGEAESGLPSTTRPAIESTPEYIASNTTCPEGLPALDSTAVRLGITLAPMHSLELSIAMTFIGEDHGLIGQRTGEIWAFGPGGLSYEPVIDLSGDTSSEHDQGLLGLAVDRSSEWLYINHTDSQGDSRIVAYPIVRGVVDGDKPEEILIVDQPSAQHNGGDLAFGPDGYLYLSFGDGGGLGDPRGNGQDLGSALGSILRVEPRPGQTPAVVAAPGNPYLSDPDKEPMIWASGVRNPFRFSFDRVIGDLWVADVGQQCLEELSVLTQIDGGANLGWNRYEGSRRFVGNSLPSRVDPIYEYSHSPGRCAVVGGYVYRGELFPELRGRYIFTDFCGGEIFAFSPDSTPAVIELPLKVTRPVGFAQDPNGELYVIDIELGIFKMEESDLS